MDTILQLQRRFGIPGEVRFDEGPGGLTCITISSDLCEAEMYLHGAHVTHFQPRGQRAVLFQSIASEFDPGKAIRGGIPICFPWFGPHAQHKTAPAHGTARVSPWEIESLQQDADGAITVALTYRQDDASLRFFPHDFVARYMIEFAHALGLKFEVYNPSPQPFRFESALHTYLLVDDVRKVWITGLEHTEYFDKTRNGARAKQAGTIRFSSEVDRVYFNTPHTCVLHDPVAGRKITVEKSASHSTIVWNPWIQKARTLKDFGDDEWQNMVCIETANVGPNAVKLDAGQSHTMTARIRVGPE
jgi:D-hexose-6-phosphate mutarotase